MDAIGAMIPIILGYGSGVGLLLCVAKAWDRVSRPKGR